MAIKKNGKSSIKLFVISAVLVAILLYLFMPSQVKKGEVAWQERSPEGLQGIQFITIRQDSLQKVLDYFTQKMGSTYNINETSDNEFVLHMSRFGSSVAPVFSGNTGLVTTTNKDAQIEVTPTNEIKARFRRVKTGDIYYVKLPSDLLFGLMKLHPNIR